MTLDCFASLAMTSLRLRRLPAQLPDQTVHRIGDITPLAEPLVTRDEEHRLRVLVQSAFGMRRKQMRRVVRTLYSLDAEAAQDILTRAGIDPEVRPEVLTVEQFVALLRVS